MSLAEASEARKARLIALRKRKEGQDGNEDGYVEKKRTLCFISPELFEHRPVLPLIKNRNFDPESRTLKKHKADDVDMEDTVEHLAQSMAAQIINDDEKRRAQELVCQLPQAIFFFFPFAHARKRTCLI